jgi:hypothetical protein
MSRKTKISVARPGGRNDNPMNCPACQGDNPADAEWCGHCRAALADNGKGPRRKLVRRRPAVEEADSPFSRHIEPANRPAAYAYRVSIFALVPGVGMLLGPLAVLLGVLALRRGKGDACFTSSNLARAAIVLGGASAVTNWAGLSLMILGLRSWFG